MNINDVIAEGKKTALGIEFGSTRIKAVLVDESNKVLAQGDHEWENHLEERKPELKRYTQKSIFATYNQSSFEPKQNPNNIN